jgi:hypothetical protein
LDLSSSSAKYDGSANSCPYLKDSLNKKSGTVYVVAGSSGQLGSTQFQYPHNAMYYSNNTIGGSLVLDVESNRLDVSWLCADGIIRDNFTLFKQVNVVKTFTVTPAQTTTIAASWPGNYVWSTGANTNTISVTTGSNTTIWVRDPNNCVADTFKFYILPTGIDYIESNTSAFNIYPNPSNGLLHINSIYSGNCTLEIRNVTGQLAYSEKISAGLNTIQLKCAAGIYYYVIRDSKHTLKRGKVILE